ncbi:hypothetical protein P3H15_49040 [Rhodococcus sp. T2V]|uniref:hypothetical protein n=1 Tax=Rhodococcus sp. T2V TaxID=3034164 RepID=UPI0023E0D4CA|nr:hypothetical protein [Rhodococcus sp. T2V]MDF3312881.1 hypothetical protein [Rhodococcus sp. T2V]
MGEDRAAVQRSAVESALYQATKHTWAVSEVDLEAIVAGERVGPLGRADTTGMDVAFLNPDSLRDVI